MLQVLLACYIELEDRLGAVESQGHNGTAYDIVKRYAEEKIGKFTSADAIAHCPSIGRSSVLAALKHLTEEGVVLRYGTGRSTFYGRAEAGSDQ